MPYVQSWPPLAALPPCANMLLSCHSAVQIIYTGPKFTGVGYSQYGFAKVLPRHYSAVTAAAPTAVSTTAATATATATAKQTTTTTKAHTASSRTGMQAAPHLQSHVLLLYTRMASRPGIFSLKQQHTKQRGAVTPVVSRCYPINPW